VYVGFGVLLAATISLGKRFEQAVVWLVGICGFSVALFGVLQAFGVGYYGGIESLTSAYAHRVPSLVGNPNFSSWFVAAIIPFGFVGLLRARVQLARIGWIIFLFINFWSLVMFSSRGALLAMAVGIVTLSFLYLVVRNWRAVLFFGVVSICAFGIFFQYYTVYRPSISEGVANISADTSASDRFTGWFMAEQAWRANPIFGNGPGNYDLFYWKHLPSTLMGGEQYFDDAHNLLVMLLADIGVPGVMLFSLLIGLAGAVCVRNLRRGDLSGWWAASASGVSVWLVAALFNPTVIALWVLLALLLAIIFISDGVLVLHDVQFSFPRRLACIVVFAGCIYVALGLVAGEYALVYSISLEPYRTYYEDAANRQRFVTSWASKIEPYNLEIRFGALATRKKTPDLLSRMSKDVRAAYLLHPGSTRAALLAAQLMTETYQITKSEGDRAEAERYLQTALAHSAGYPVTYSWAAYYYWQVGNVELSERYARLAAAKQPHYYYNWLLLAKQARERGSFQAMTYALKKAQSIVPGNEDLKKVRKQLAETKDVRSFDIRPGEPSVLVRLHQ
jgi:O-antigen ligase